MDVSVESIHYSLASPTKSKIIAVEVSLQQSFSDFKVLVEEIERIHIINETLKTQLLSQKEVSQRKDCTCEEMKTSLVLTRFNEAKDWNILNEAFNILLGETVVMTPPKENHEVKLKANAKDSDNGHPQSPQKLDSTTEDISFKEDSVMEIDGTPTGRTSPIIQPKKTRSTTISGIGEKKKCSTNWPTPEKKTLRTPSRSTPNSKLRQSRLAFVKMKATSVVDLTLSPEFSGGIRCSQTGKNNSQICVKKEPMNNDDTILPSPTSGPVVFTLHKNTSKTSHQKLKSLSRKKRSTDSSENAPADQMEDSVNLLANRLKKDTKPVSKEQTVKEVLSPQKRPLAENINCVNIDLKPAVPLRLDTNFKLPKEDIVKRCPNKLDTVLSTNEVTTHSQNDDSISLLKHAPISKYVEPNFVEPPIDTDITYCETEATVVGDKMLNRLLNNKEVNPAPLYKEPAPRTKAEKLARQGWCCRDCKDFWSETYKDDPEMLKKKMEESSKHRGHHNPERPNTPEGYWYPRWNVPDDTEEFNRRNNAV